MNPQTDQSVAGRRDFVSKAMIGAVGIAAAGLVFPGRAKAAVAPPLTFADIPGTGDIKVLNYALALEDLEANLYVQALKRLTNGGVNDVGVNIPGLGLPATAPDVKYIAEFGQVEAEHKALLTSVLGSQALPLFNYNFGIEKLSRAQVLDLVYSAERTGVSAYLGAIPYLATKNYLQIAGAIEGTEARHTAVIAQVIDYLFNQGVQVAPLYNQFNGIDQPAPPNTVLALVSPFIIT